MSIVQHGDNQGRNQFWLPEAIGGIGRRCVGEPSGEARKRVYVGTIEHPWPTSDARVTPLFTRRDDPCPSLASSRRGRHPDVMIKNAGHRALRRLERFGRRSHDTSPGQPCQETYSVSRAFLPVLK